LTSRHVDMPGCERTFPPVGTSRLPDRQRVDCGPLSSYQGSHRSISTYHPAFVRLGELLLQPGRLLFPLLHHRELAVLTCTPGHPSSYWAAPPESTRGARRPSPCLCMSGQLPSLIEGENHADFRPAPELRGALTCSPPRVCQLFPRLTSSAAHHSPVGLLYRSVWFYSPATSLLTQPDQPFIHHLLDLAQRGMGILLAPVFPISTINPSLFSFRCGSPSVGRFLACPSSSRFACS